MRLSKLGQFIPYWKKLLYEPELLMPNFGGLDKWVYYVFLKTILCRTKAAYDNAVHKTSFVAQSFASSLA
jgi:hypothetical protein